MVTTFVTRFQRSGSSKVRKSPMIDANKEWTAYDHFPLLQGLLKHEIERNSFLDEEGVVQSKCPKSTSGWMRTIFVGSPRAFDYVWPPWIFAVLHATIFSFLKHYDIITFSRASTLDDWRSLFTFALNSTLGFLLVFRLNRAAIRFWDAREKWGTIVADVRNLVSSLLVHGNHDLAVRDEAIRWACAFPLACKDFIREEIEWSSRGYAGILREKQVRLMEQKNKHPPLFAALQIRQAIHVLMSSNKDMDLAGTLSRAQQLQSMESLIDALIRNMGALERIKSTPLPIVYVTHLRTFLLINLLLLPYLWGQSWGWYAVPIVGITGKSISSQIYKEA